LEEALNIKIVGSLAFFVLAPIYNALLKEMTRGIIGATPDRVKIQI
jgi:hypothetical protein